VASSSSETPTITNPCGPYCFCNSTNQGISALHGGHHVAQKFSTTALPRKSERRTVFPDRSFSAKSGAGLPLKFESIDRGSLGAFECFRTLKKMSAEMTMTVTANTVATRFTLSGEAGGGSCPAEDGTSAPGEDGA
jgi:hypothetical protein